MTVIGSWGLQFGWAWHDAWIWGVVRRFTCVGMLFVVLGPFRMSINFPVRVEAETEVENACTASRVSTPA